MLDKFWGFFLTSDPLEMGYIHEVSYQDDVIKMGVIEKLDWLVSKLNEDCKEHKFDCELVSNIKTNIITGGLSLTENGVDYLNLLISTCDLKEYL